jgi:hypothetical protein
MKTTKKELSAVVTKTERTRTTTTTTSKKKNSGVAGKFKSLHNQVHFVNRSQDFQCTNCGTVTIQTNIPMQEEMEGDERVVIASRVHNFIIEMHNNQPLDASSYFALLDVVYFDSGERVTCLLGRHEQKGILENETMNRFDYSGSDKTCSASFSVKLRETNRNHTYTEKNKKMQRKFCFRITIFRSDFYAQIPGLQRIYVADSLSFNVLERPSKSKKRQREVKSEVKCETVKSEYVSVDNIKHEHNHAKVEEPPLKKQKLSCDGEQDKLTIGAILPEVKSETTNAECCLSYSNSNCAPEFTVDGFNEQSLEGSLFDNLFTGLDDNMCPEEEQPVARSTTPTTTISQTEVQPSINFTNLMFHPVAQDLFDLDPSIFLLDFQDQQQQSTGTTTVPMCTDQSGCLELSLECNESM